MEGTEPLLNGSTAPTSRALHAVKPRRSRASPQVLPAKHRAAQKGKDQSKRMMKTTSLWSTAARHHGAAILGAAPGNAQRHARLSLAGALRSLRPLSQRGRALFKAQVEDGGLGGPQDGEGAPQTLPTPQLPTEVCMCTLSDDL